jgi:hypothetical protein
MRFRDVDGLHRVVRTLAAAAVLFALTGVGFRFFAGRREPSENVGPVGTGGGINSPAARKVTQVKEGHRPQQDRVQPGRMEVQSTESKIPAPEEQTTAIREAVIRETVRTLRLAALRGDMATVRGLVPGLKRRKENAVRILEESLRAEMNPSARAVLQDVMIQPQKSAKAALFGPVSL